MTFKLGSTYLLPVIAYAGPVWSYVATMHKRSLQSVLDKRLKLPAKRPSSILFSASEKGNLCSLRERNLAASSALIL